MSTTGVAPLPDDPVAAARALLGRVLIRDDARGRRRARIVEVEAYGGPDDLASHARFGRTERNAVMYGPAGIAYVYLVYGMYDCLNVVVGPAGEPAAVLIRALEPIEGRDLMRLDRTERAIARRRGVDPAAEAAIRARVAGQADVALARGPGLVGAALGLDRSWTGTDLFTPASALRIDTDAEPVPPDAVVATARIGIGYAGEPWASVPWRFALAGHPSVSGSRAAR